MTLHAVFCGALVFAATSAAPALAQAPTAPANNGAMSFPNVRVVNVAPVESSAPRAQGLRAYLDPENGRLTDPSQESVQELEAAISQGPAKRLRKSMSYFTHPSGAVGVRGDQEFMSYSVVRRATDGRLIEACVLGEALALELLRTGTLEAKGLTQ